MRRAALCYHPEGYTTAGGAVLGRRVAGAEFLRGLLRHGGLEEVVALVQSAAHRQAFTDHVAEIAPVARGVEAVRVPRGVMWLVKLDLERRVR